MEQVSIFEKNQNHLLLTDVVERMKKFIGSASMIVATVLWVVAFSDLIGLVKKIKIVDH